MSKLLLVEDDKSFAQNLLVILKSARFAVDHALSAEEATGFLDTYSYDAVILDWELPGASGPELCKRIKQNSQSLPVIMLTGRTGTPNAVFGLDAGADDYVQKPCSSEELIARLRALLRRQGQETTEVITCGRLTIIESLHQAEVCGAPLDLSRREFELLRFFMLHPNKTFTPDALFSRIWINRDDVSAELVRMYVKKLRTKLEASTGTACIETVAGKGYMLPLETCETLELKQVQL